MTSERHTSIDFSPLLNGLERPLQLVSEPERRREMEAYVAAARPHVERAAFDVLAQAVAAFNDASQESRARLEYRDGGLHLSLSPLREGAEAETSFDEGDLERVTLRLPRELKHLIDRAADRHGVSANTWYVRALSRVISRDIRDSVRGEARAERHGHRGRRHGGSRRGVVGDNPD